MASMPPTILVTGGCGYIGSVLVPALVAKGWSVRVLDSLLFGTHLPESAFASKAVELRRADIRDARAVGAALEGVDAVIHLAAIANDPSADLDPALTRSVNLDAVLALLKAARVADVRRFVNASSATVYGVREEAQVDETLDHRPISLYGKYKSETDIAVASSNADDFVCVNIRSATVCGWSPRMRLDLTVNILTEQAVNSGRITVHGGQQMRPNVVLPDLVRAYLSALAAPAAEVGGESFNIGASNRSIRDIAEAVARSVAPTATIEIQPLFDARSYRISSAKARRVLDFSPSLDVEDAALDVATAIRAGRVPNPEQSVYRNVAHMKARAVS